MNHISSQYRPWKFIILSSSYRKSICDYLTCNKPVKCNYMSTITRNITPNSQPKMEGDTFQAKRALILTKFSRYEFEKRTNPNLSEEQLIDKVGI